LSGEFDRQALEAERRLLNFVVSEVNRNDRVLPPLVLAELEQALVVAFLCSSRHNYTHRLNGPSSAVAPQTVRRAEEHIDSHWNEPITVEALALVAGTSVRSLFASFRKSRGCSPMAFIKQVRLQHANAMLNRPDLATSVTSVAFACGFGNLGHFAKDYFNSFGELPSDTLRRSKR
jgi:transcriptional regulator GlxA family with amidase domain